MHNTYLKSSRQIDYLYTNIYNKLRRKDVLVFGIKLDSNYEELIDDFDGIIFEGGDIHEKYELLALKYCYDNDIPTLGICLGMQLMGIMLGGYEEEVLNHSNINHDIIINDSSILKQIYNKKIINVNSRHNYVIKGVDRYVSAKDLYGNIEAIEDGRKKFFLGVQFHPEDMDPLIFDYFIEVLNENK